MLLLIISLQDNSTPGDSLDRRQFSTEIQALSRSVSNAGDQSVTKHNIMLEMCSSGTGMLSKLA